MFDLHIPTLRSSIGKREDSQSEYPELQKVRIQDEESSAHIQGLGLVI
jgi:hypothetical protein